MTICICLIQEGQISDSVRTKLERGISAVSQTYNISNEVNFAWVAIPKGDGWTAGKPSTSSVVTLHAPPLEQATREKILSELCEVWTRESGCHINEIVFSVMSPTAAQ
jgi:hypothetical protein